MYLILPYINILPCAVYHGMCHVPCTMCSVPWHVPCTMFHTDCANNCWNVDIFFESLVIFKINLSETKIHACGTKSWKPSHSSMRTKGCSEMFSWIDQSRVKLMQWKCSHGLINPLKCSHGLINLGFWPSPMQSRLGVGPPIPPYDVSVALYDVDDKIILHLGQNVHPRHLKARLGCPASRWPT